MYKKMIDTRLDYSRSITPVWREIVDPVTKEKSIEKVGDTDLDVAIQKAAEGCDLKAIVRNLQNGVTSSLPASSPSQFGDTTALPTDLVSASQSVESHKAAAFDSFKKLPDDLKSQFKSADEFFGKFNADFLNKYISEKMKEKEVKDNGK